jgi:arabinogalactan endo-1,4-beta-galactosidase
MARLTVRYLAPIAMFLGPTVAFGQQPLNDSLQESVLDSCRWEFVSSNNGTYNMQNGLMLISDGTQSISVATVYSQYYAPGDFDVQVDYALGSTWTAPIVANGSGAHLEGAAFTAYFDSQNSLAVFRSNSAGLDQLYLYGVVDGQTVATGFPFSGLTGTLRIRRIGMSIDFMGLIGNSWTEVGNWTGPIRPAVFGLTSANVNANNSVSTTFTNFQLNSGATNYQAYELPANPTPHPGFLPGWVSDEHLSWTVWGGFKGYDPQSILFANGVGILREMITTVSDTALADTPFSQWGTLPWNNDYWSSLQMGEQLLRQAKSLGMQTYLTLMMSDIAANAGVQNAPSAWQGLSLDQTIQVLQQYTNQTAAYFVSRGIKIDMYAIGNEIGTGILNFVPGQRLPAPQNASPYDAIEFMEQNVWPTEAQLLNAAIAGIKQADPNAKIVLHIAGLTLSPADLWTKAFFTTMVNLGVPFDIAGVSLPYMSGPGWTLPEYTPQCWCQKLAADFREFAALGKQGIIAEGVYPNTTVNITANAPMPAYPITPQGQAAWIADMLRYASNDPNVIGFNYTFPDALPGVFGPNPPIDIESFSLFVSATSVEPGMLEFNPFIGSTNCPSQCPTLNLSHQADSTVSPDGAAIGYALAVSNHGAGTASSVDLNDPLPAGGGINWSIAPAYNGPGTCTVSGVTGNQVLGCSFGNLAAGATAWVHIASSTTSASCQTYGNTALLTADNNTPIQSTANITVQCVPLAISGPAALPAGAIGVPYFATTVKAVGGIGAYTWAAAGLPGGLSIASSTGAITGIPTTTAGSPFTVDIAATDNTPTTVHRSYTLAVSAFSACDVTQAGTTAVADVQRVINEALGTATASHDLNLDGFVNVADIQIVISAALGLGCAAL